MTIATKTVSTFRQFAAAALLASLAATSILPAPAMARDEARTERSILTERKTEAAKGKGTIVMKCGYIKKKHKPYKPSHVKIKAYKTKVNCNTLHKGSIVIRSFRGETANKTIKESVAKTANQYYS